MTQHTPGPWWTGEYNGAAYIGAKREIDGAREDCWIVQPGCLYDEDNEPTLEELEANARLIAAAPDLLEAAQEFTESLDLIQGMGHLTPTGLQRSPYVEKLRIAIAKAKGGTA